MDSIVMLFDWKVSVGQKRCVGRVIVAGMEITQLLVCKVWNVVWVSAAVVVVSDCWKQRRLQGLVDLRGSRAHGAFHLVVDHAFDFEL